jgi:hypothetical protein
MKRLHISLSIFVLASSAFAGPLQKQFEAQMAKIDKCLLNKDIAGFEKLVKPMVTKDYKHIENGRTLTYDQMIVQMKQGVGMMEEVTVATSKFLSFKQTGNTVVAKQSHKMEGIVMGEDKKKHTMGFTGVTVNTYRKVGGMWKMAIMDWKKQDMLMDGKPFDPSKMGG